MMIKRAFADVGNRQVHYRHAGPDGGIPLILFHASPGSSKQLEPLISALSAKHRVIALDTPGNGDSTPLSIEAPVIADYARAAIEFMDAMGMPAADVYGSHTGGVIAGELAILAPDRVRRVVQDGVGVFSPETRDDYLAHYAHPFTPDLDGAYLMRAFMFCRDQYLFFPWFKRDTAHQRLNGLPQPEALHNWVVEVLKSATTYPMGYRAAFSYPVQERLPLITQPVLAVAAEDDPLREMTEEITKVIPQGRYKALPRYDAGYLQALAAVIGDFLDA